LTTPIRRGSITFFCAPAHHLKAQALSHWQASSGFLERPLGG
jgi:hypothetical protein